MAEFDTLQIRKIDGGLLLIFRELLLRRRASAVAGQLGLSPSAISHALTRLRDVFGDPLFIRRSHGLEPTQRALELGPQVEQLIKLIGTAVGGDAGFDPGDSHRRFRIVCPDHIASMLGGPLADAFREAPNATFSVRPAFLDRALRAVRRDEADVAIGIFEQIPRGLAATPLYEDHYCVIARVGHPRVAGAIDWPTYADISHVFCGIPDGLLADDAAFYDRRAMTATYGDNPGPGMIRTQAYFAQWESIMLLVAETDLLADCPRRLAERFAARLGLQIVAPPYPPFAMPVQAVRRADAPDAGVGWLMQKIAAAFA